MNIINSLKLFRVILFTIFFLSIYPSALANSTYQSLNKIVTSHHELAIHSSAEKLSQNPLIDYIFSCQTLQTSQSKYDITKNLEKKDSKQSSKYYSILTILSLFLFLGLLLSVSPCILPMATILSSIILRRYDEKETSQSKAFFLSLAYVLGISTAYALLGFLTSLLGSSIPNFLQQPYIILFFGCIFVLLALSLFGLFEFSLLNSISDKLARFSQTLTNTMSKNYFTVAIMGFFSALVLSPCVTPPLIGSLLFVASTGNIFLGTVALFFMGIGLGTPLLIIGILGPKIIPKAGAWMETIKLILGVILLSMAAALWQQVIPLKTTPLLWGTFIFVISLLLFYRIQFKTNITRILFQTFCLLGMLYGALPIVKYLRGVF
jgi:thioredoxin:protein disulfide reductase